MSWGGWKVRRWIEVRNECIVDEKVCYFHGCRCLGIAMGCGCFQGHALFIVPVVTGG